MKIKSFFASVLFIGIAAFAHAQEAYRGSVTVFSEAGENFTLFLNGDQKNASPGTRVVADNITEVPVSFRIVFENGGIHELKKNGLRAGKDCIYMIQKNKKGEHVLKVKGCTSPFDDAAASVASADNAAPSAPTAPTGSPSTLSASFANGIITLNDGRLFTVTKVAAGGMTYPQVMMNSPQGTRATISYDDNTEQFNAEIPFKYEVKDFSLNNALFTLTVDEGGPDRTWHVKLQHSNGFDLKID